LTISKKGDGLKTSWDGFMQSPLIRWLKRLWTSFTEGLVVFEPIRTAIDTFKQSLGRAGESFHGMGISWQKVGEVIFIAVITKVVVDLSTIVDCGHHHQLGCDWIGMLIQQGSSSSSSQADRRTKLVSVWDVMLVCRGVGESCRGLCR
jgi:hypothetical protein